ncbi:MAG: rhodanese-related sulfurtransferase [SAR202 cluster bacterium]|nr:rhodanese-related sulfurtransferase [SAR202 cluster bacterium]|tara:strand:- start:872 stop:1858 length:987 start_codon:yes stop_codon:yes gene_type:complete
MNTPSTQSYEDGADLLVAALYHFTKLTNLDEKQVALEQICKSNSILGTLLLADEGINGTIAGNKNGIKNVVNYISEWPEISELELKYSFSSHQNFNRLKVRIKDEIVTMGKGDINVKEHSGTYVDPKDWNELIARDDVILIDARNEYEVAMGQFEGAIDPKTDTFRQFPSWADQLNQQPDSPKKVAMYCTGGIRCEKASSYMKTLGFDEVFHLKGGILKYLEVVPEEESLWEGECFVFDDRVSLVHGLEEGEYSLCYGCQDPVSPKDRESEFYEAGVSCPSCHNTLSEQKKINLREREKQFRLAQERGQYHLGDKSNSKKRYERRSKK